MKYQEWKLLMEAQLKTASNHISEARELGVETMRDFYDKFPEKREEISTRLPIPPNLREGMGEKKWAAALSIIRSGERDDGQEDSLIKKAQADLGLQIFEIAAVRQATRR